MWMWLLTLLFDPDVTTENTRASPSLDPNPLQRYDIIHRRSGLWFLFRKPHSSPSSPADWLNGGLVWTWPEQLLGVIHHPSTIFLNCTIITFFSITERESTAKGVEVTQQGTSSELPECFITSLVTVLTCPGSHCARLCTSNLKLTTLRNCVNNWIFSNSWARL